MEELQRQLNKDVPERRQERRRQTMKLFRSLLADGAPGRRGFRAPEANGSKITSAAALTGVGLGLPFTILSFSSCSPSPQPRALLENVTASAWDDRKPEDGNGGSENRKMPGTVGVGAGTADASCEGGGGTDW
ncbi:unnamed protein product [Miscanthus lutarioriparius]|uniref:Uncharacterized protein n=1 Tax=Miscanthus lutarioriparius TaxID=422564 RepID=A0A811PAM1_9POAL|nr:unnamed protein product [Miscanthus lutarioriparius]